MRVLRTTNFTNLGYLDFNNVVERNVDPIIVEKKKLRYGDIILEKSGGSPSQPVGRVVYFDINNETIFLCNNFTTIIRAKKGMHSKYLFWFLFFNHITNNTLRFQNKTTGILNLQLSRYLDSLLIPHTSFESQKQIANILDEADELQRKDKLLLAKYDELLQSIFYNMFGDIATNSKNWNTEKLGGLCLIRRGASPRPISNYEGGSVPWIKIGDGSKGSSIYIEKTSVGITEEGAKKSVYLSPGSLIFANCGVSLGFARILKISGCIHDGWLSLEKVDETRINKIFLLKLINSITQYLRDKAPDGTQPNLNTGIMKELKVPIPDIKLQRQFEEIVLKFESNQKLVIEQYEKSQELFQCLLQKAFKGQLIN